MTLRSIINNHRENKAERVIWREARSASDHLMDTDQYETRWNIGRTPAGMDQQEYMRRVGKATVELCQIRSFIKHAYAYDHEASLRSTAEYAALPEEALRQCQQFPGLRAVFHKVVDPFTVQDTRAVEELGEPY